MNFASKLVWVGLVSLLDISMCSADELPTKNPGSGNAAPSGFNLWVNPGFISYHIDRHAPFRGRNWGWGVQSDLSDNLTALAGNYINSDYARTSYAGVAWQPLTWHSAKIGLVGGILDGYPAMRNGGVFPAILPWISFRHERVGVNFTLIPSFASRGLHGAIVAQLTLRAW